MLNAGGNVTDEAVAVFDGLLDVQRTERPEAAYLFAIREVHPKHTQQMVSESLGSSWEKETDRENTAFLDGGS